MTENEKKLRKNIGKKIKLARSKTNYTQEALAEKTSLSPRYISQLERGIAFGSASTIVGLCKALNISSDFLFSDLIKSDSSEYINMIDNKSPKQLLNSLKQHPPFLQPFGLSVQFLLLASFYPNLPVI